MSTTYLMTMPVMIYNLGVEMIYILSSRLKAQQIEKDKSIKVIHDIVASVFEKKFINEIRKKQEIAKHQSVRQLFDKLAHCSIMKLNQTSMSKLFDLMMMTFKYQILRSKFPEELYQITLNHLNSLLLDLNINEKENEDIIELVKENIDYFDKTYGSMSSYGYLIIKQTILRFFQGNNVKVSIFIQDGLQNYDGIIQLPMKELSPPGVKQPGNVVKYKSNGEIVGEYTLTINSAALFEKNDSTERIKIISTTLGKNMFDMERKAKVLDSSQTQELDVSENKSFNLSDINSEKNTPKSHALKNAIQGEKSIEFNQNNSNHIISKEPNGSSESYFDDENRKVNVDYLKKEFGQLAELLNVPTKRKDESDTFKIDLFKMRGGLKFNERKNNQLGNEHEEIYVEVKREIHNLDRIKNMFDDMNVDAEIKNDGDDLLDLMDS